MNQQQRQAYTATYEALKPLGFTHADLATLHRYEATLQRLNEEACNGWPTWYNGRIIYDWNEKEAEENQRKQDRVQARVTRLVESHGITAKFGGDPRGCAIRLLLPADENGRRRSNSWDGETWVIDW